MTKSSALFDQFHGLTNDHVVALEQPFHNTVHIHSQILKPWLKLKKAAEASGFKPFILSGFRDYHRQLAIWNRKIAREIEIKDRHNAILPIGAPKSELIEAILSWSAIPGYSRHHWGTDIDIFDASHLDDNYQIKLEPCEFNQTTGPCFLFERWLDLNVEQFGFYRPYQTENQGVAIEPWHLSHIKTSAPFMNAINFTAFERFIQTSQLDGKVLILSNIHHIFDFYINNSSYQAPAGL
jgi:LAS superfamily LD-carboxypeptidase LdcB